MVVNYDIWMVLLSLTVSSFAMFVSFSFVNRLYRSSATGRLFLLPIYSITVGSGIWGIHFYNWLAFHSGVTFQFSAPFMLASWLAALFVGFVTCYVASKKLIPLRLLASSGLMAGLSSYAMYYLYAMSLNISNSVTVEPLSVFIALLLSVSVSVLALLTLSWMKEYSGENKLLIKLIFSLITAVAIIGLHITFSASINADANSTLTTVSEVANKKMLAAIISLSIVCLFLLVFAVAIFYEKFGKNTFKFNILNKQKNVIVNALDAKDALTQLPNRRAFQHQLEAAAKRCIRTGETIAIAYIDLDHFKPINDSFGHHIGDAVLTAVAQRLQAAVRGCDSVARLGGDEFVALIEEIKSDEDIIPIVERIVNSIKEPFLVNRHQIEISCSVGIAIYPRDGDIEKLMVCADKAMYKAKENGKNQFRFYDAEIESASDQMLELHRDLHIAVEHHQFNLLFQPKVDCKTQSPVGAEALIRWNHPIKGMLPPKDFIAAAESFGLIDEINKWVIEEVCCTIQRARQEGIDLNISINLAHQQFRNANLVHEVTEVLREHKVPPSNITFEIRETVAIKNERQFKLLLAQFKLAKLKIALDNFGLRPFTLAYLQSLNIDELKLDKIFISKIDTNKASQALINAAIRLAHALDLNIVAEGVETEMQREVLLDLGCNHMQGYLFSRPITEDKLFKLLKEHKFNNQLADQSFRSALLKVSV